MLDNFKQHFINIAIRNKMKPKCKLNISNIQILDILNN